MLGRAIHGTVDTASGRGPTMSQHESPRPAAVPYLAVKGARDAVDWYGTVFGAVVDGEPFENDDGTIGHVALRSPTASSTSPTRHRSTARSPRPGRAPR